MIDFSLFCATFRVDAMCTIAVQLKHLYCAGALLETRIEDELNRRRIE